MNEPDAKKYASEAAKKFFDQAKSQDDASLAKRLAVSLPLSAGSRKAACFWFAAQKTYLLGREHLQDIAEQPLKLEYAKSCFRGALDLATRCEQAFGQDVEKALALKARCQAELDGLVGPTPKEMPKETLKKGSLKDQLQYGPLKKSLSDPAAMRHSMREFLAAQESTAQEKLQFLPDTKLINVLGFDALDGFSLPAKIRKMLQHLVHLQILFDTAQQVNDVNMQAVTIKMILVDVRDMDTSVIQVPFLRDGAFMVIQILHRRVVEWAQLRGVPFDEEYLYEKKQQVEVDLQLVKSCFRLGFSFDSVQAQLTLSLTSRGFFIGQGLLLAAQTGVNSQLLFDQEFEESLVDYPIFAVLPAGYRLFISMAGTDSIAQVALHTDLVKALKKQGWIATEYFEVAEDRTALRLAQVSHTLEQLTLATQLEDANKVAQFLFLHLSELGIDWPEMFTQVAGVKSLLRRKNLKIVWHDQTPFWTLKLRTEMQNPLQNKPFPRAQQVVKLLKRFEV